MTDLGLQQRNESLKEWRQQITKIKREVKASEDKLENDVNLTAEARWKEERKISAKKSRARKLQEFIVVQSEIV